MSNDARLLRLEKALHGQRDDEIEVYLMDWGGDGGCTSGAGVHYTAAEYQEHIENDAARGGKHIVIDLQWPEGLSHE